MPIYLFSDLVAMKSILKQMSNLQRNFIWGGTPQLSSTLYTEIRRFFIRILMSSCRIFDEMSILKSSVIFHQNTRQTHCNGGFHWYIDGHRAIFYSTFVAPKSDN